MKHVKDKMIPAVLILVLLVIWEAAVDLLHIPLYVLPSPLEVVKALFTEGTELFSHGLTTVGEGLLGILIASALSLVPGCAKGTLSYSGSDPDGSHDRYGSDPDHLYGIWNGTEDPYGSSYVFLSSGSQFCRRTAAGRRRICTSGALLWGRPVESLLPGKDTGSAAGTVFRTESGSDLQHQRCCSRRVAWFPEGTWLLPVKGKEQLYAG